MNEVRCMDIQTILVIALAIVNISILILVIWTLYEFIKLDKELFRSYIIGLFFYGITVMLFFIQYIILAPLSTFENAIIGSGTYIFPLVGIFYFLKGTEDLARKETSTFTKNEVLYKTILYLFVIESVYLILYLPMSFVSKDIYEIYMSFSYLLYSICVVLAVILFLEYRTAFTDVFKKIISHYIIAVGLLIGAGTLITYSLAPVQIGDATLMEISLFRIIIALFGSFIIFIPFLICYVSVYKFRKALQG